MGVGGLRERVQIRSVLRLWDPKTWNLKNNSEGGRRNKISLVPNLYYTGKGTPWFSTGIGAGVVFMTLPLNWLN